jgi:putative transposase
MKCWEHRMEAVRRRLWGEQITRICRNLSKSAPWFSKWWHRYQELGPEGLFDDTRKAHNIANKTDRRIEAAIVHLRQLQEKRDQKHTTYALIGAPSIAKELRELGFNDIPAMRTITTILKRNRLIKTRTPNKKEPWNKRDSPAPPAQYPNDVHQMEFVGPWDLNEDGTKDSFPVLQDVASLAVAVDACDTRTAPTVTEFIVPSWQNLGIPTILQVDHAWEFRGSNRYPRSLSRLIRLCLLLEVAVLFIPVRHPWRNGTVENFNGLLAKLVLKTQQFREFAQVKAEIPDVLDCCNRCHVHKPLDDQTAIPFRANYPDRIRRLDKDFSKHQEKKKLPISDGPVSFIRQVRRSGRIPILTEKFEIDKELAYESVCMLRFLQPTTCCECFIIRSW